MALLPLSGRRVWQAILDKLFPARQRRRSRNHRPIGFRPSVEVLENRLAPAIFNVASSQELIDAIDTADTSLDANNTINLAPDIYNVSDQLISALSVHTLVIAGPGPNTAPPVVAITAGGTGRVFQIDANVTFQNVLITGGVATDGGQVGGTAALGGGLLIDGGNVVLSNVNVTGNAARGARGDNGASGANPGANGNDGTAGAAAYGGGIYLAKGSLTLKLASINNNNATGGAGGTGGAGVAGSAGINKLAYAGDHGATGQDGDPGARGAPCSIGHVGGAGGDGKTGGAGSGGQNGGNGGVGGDGGAAGGGGIYVAAGEVTIINSALTGDQAVGGIGGAGGAGNRGGNAAGTGGTGGFGGFGGFGGTGGAFTAHSTGRFIGGGSGGPGGNGGVGGHGGGGGSGGAGGTGGNGGKANGGGLYITTGSVLLANSSITGTKASSTGGGAGGPGGAGGNGANGGIGGTGGFGGFGGDAGHAPAPFNGLSSGGMGGEAGAGGFGGAGGDAGPGGQGGAGGFGGDTAGGCVFVEDSAFFTLTDGTPLDGTAPASPGGAGGAGGLGSTVVGLGGAAGAAGEPGTGGNPGGAAGLTNAPGQSGIDGNPGADGDTGSTGTDGTNKDDTVSGRQFSAPALLPPAVTPNTNNLPANATSLTIFGSGFSPTPADNTVAFSDSATGIVTGASGIVDNGGVATATRLTVSFLSGLTVGSLTATVTTIGVSSGTPVQVATVIPVVTPSAADLGANATTMFINGFGFDDTTPGSNVVSFNGGSTGIVTAATTTQLTVTSLSILQAGALTASVTVDGVSSGAAVQVASVRPVVTSYVGNLPANGASLTIKGFGFSTTPASNAVKFSGGVTGHVTGASSNSLTVTGLTGLVAGNLSATVTTAGVTSALAQVATVQPVVTVSNAILPANMTTLTIDGFGFSSTASNNKVTFNGIATGIVTKATATTLTVTSLSGLTAGSLTVTVTSNSVTSSASLVQVATVIPVVTKSTASLGDDATSLIINGFGFDATTPGNNHVTFNGGVTGTATKATATQLTVSVSGIVLGSLLTASVSVNGQSSGTPVQVATVTSSITPNTTDLAANATTLIINGSGFSGTVTGNTVKFSGGATGKVTFASSNQLTISDLSGLVAGSLLASVTAGGLTSALVQVATVQPVVTVSTANLAANLTTLTIDGIGFSSTASNNKVTFNGIATGIVTKATATKLTVTSLSGLTAGSLTVTVISNTVTSTASLVQVATVTPVVTKSTASLGDDATSLIINGFGFDATTPGNNIVSFNDGVTGTVSHATTTQLTVSGLSGADIFGPLTASVQISSENSGPKVQVATVTSSITASTSDLAANATTLLIHGLGFSTSANKDTVKFSGGVTGKVTGATATVLTISDLSGLVAGSLSASVTVGGLTSAFVQVATVQPVVTSSTANLAANATTLTIDGFGFSKIASNNTVTFSGIATGIVTKATATTLTVTGLSGLTKVGSLTVKVTSNTVSSASPVPVATVIPVVTKNTATLAANGTSLTIKGLDFDTTTLSKNVVTFSGGVTGTVTGATPTTLTVHLSGALPSGSLTASVSVDLQSSGPAVQVATVVPAVTFSSATLAANAASLTINGSGFSLTPGQNTVTFSDGATGVVTKATATTLTVTNLRGLVAGSLSAMVTVGGLTSTLTQVATVQPVVTVTTTNLRPDATTLTIHGFGFSKIAGNNTVKFNGRAKGIVTSATATTLTVTELRGLTVGSLTVTVTSNGETSEADVQVGTVV